MTQVFSDETRALLERADRAIEESLRLRALARKQMEGAERRTFQLEMMVYRNRAQQSREK